MEREYSYLKWEQKDWIGMIRFYKPEALNALPMDFQEELLDLLPRLNRIEDLWVVIITVFLTVPAACAFI